MKWTGKCSTFGGVKDAGMVNDEGLALYEHSEADLRPDLFLTRSHNLQMVQFRLMIDRPYIALCFDKVLAKNNRKLVQSMRFKVTNPGNGKSEVAELVDYGPGWQTGRIADLSPGLAARIGLDTDNLVEVELIEQN